jgi:hypothetical protein
MYRAVTEGVRIDTVHMLVELQSSCPKMRINEIAKTLGTIRLQRGGNPMAIHFGLCTMSWGFRGLVLLGIFFSGS